MESNGASAREGLLPLKKRKTAVRGAASATDDDAPLPLNAVKKSKRAAAGSHESEFVSVEVGLRELHKRMASSGATPTKRAASGQSKKSTVEDLSLKEPPAPSTAAKKPTASRSRKPTEKVTEAAPSAPTPPKRRAPSKNKTDPTAALGGTVSPAKTAVPTPKKRATAVTRGTSTTATPTSFTTTKRAATSPKPAASGALASARAAAMQQQQERVLQRVQGLQRAVEAPATAASPQPPQVPPQPPQLQAPQEQEECLVESHRQQSDSQEQPGVVKQEVEPSQSSQGFIEEDFDEDLAFLQALEEVERKLQPTTISTTLSPSSTSSPAALMPVVLPATGLAPACTTSVDPTPYATINPAPVQIASSATSVHSALLAATASSTVQVNTENIVQKESELSESGLAPRARETGSEFVKQEQDVLNNATLDTQSVISAIPSELLAEYERLKRENEALRRSNDQLQAEKANQDAGSHLTFETQPVAIDAAMDINSKAEHNPALLDPVNANNGGGAVKATVDTASTSVVAQSTEPFVTQSLEIGAAHKPTSSLLEQSGASTASAQHCLQVYTDEEAGVKLAGDTKNGRSDVDTYEYGHNNEAMDGIEECGDDKSPRVNLHADKTDEVEDGRHEVMEDAGDEERPNATPQSRVSTIDRGNYSQYRAKNDEDVDDDDDDEDSPMQSRPRVAANHKSKSLVSAGSHRRSAVAVAKPSAASIAAMAPPIVDDGSETESDEELQKTSHRHIPSLPQPSSSSSSDESDDEGAQTGVVGLNVLEAALRAATGRSSVSATPKEALKRSGAPQSDGAKTSPEKRARIQIKMEEEEPSVVAVSESAPAGRNLKKRQAATKSAGAMLSLKDKSSLMWPTLDDFYDFVLDLTPRRVLHSDPLHLQLLRAYEKARARLPMHYPGITQYCGVQQESILEELLSSVRNAEEVSLHHSSRARLWLASISPCSSSEGRSATIKNAGATNSPMPLRSNVIFMESGFSGTSAVGKSDFIVTFQEGRVGPNQKSVLGDFVSGDLLAIRSPEWRGRDVYAFGIVLCSSVVAVGGTASSRDGNGSTSNPDQLCVLLRAPPATDEYPDAPSHFASVMEMCLVNQRSSQWSWSLEQVHNLTTSAREFQAIKSVRFFKPETKEMLMSGIIPEISKSEQTQIIEPRKKLTNGLYEELETKYNPSQLHAILGAISDDSSISIIQGPPGTGKTKTILGVLSALLDGAALTASRQAQVKSRIRIGASLEKRTSTATAATPDKKTVAQDSIRVLVAAPSNAAVDELIVRLLSEGVYDARQRKSYRPRIVRVGRPESLQQQQHASSDSHQEQDFTRKKKWRKYASEVEEILLENLVNKNKSAFPTAKQARQTIIQNAQIVFCTLSGAGSVAMCELRSQHFDALVIDEAAQAVEASLLIPFKFQPSRVVLVGDHRQLPATVISKRLIELGYDRSLFQRLVENGSRVFMLTQQYRMHPEISWFPSTYFYNSKLIEAPQMKDWTARKYHREPTFRPFVFFDVLAGQQSQVSGSKSLRNVNEIECILVLLTRLVVEQFPEMEWRRKIGIIAPYKQQIYELRNELQRWEKKYDKRLDIEVNTVDGFQGREKEVIIYSCVRTSRAGRGGSSSRHNGQTIEAFWADERRMNVAITRAKSSLWIIGNSTLLKQSAAWRALITHAKDSRRYISDEELMGATRAKSSGSVDRGRESSRDRDRARSRSRDRSRNRRRR